MKSFNLISFHFHRLMLSVHDFNVGSFMLILEIPWFANFPNFLSFYWVNAINDKIWCSVIEKSAKWKPSILKQETWNWYCAALNKEAFLFSIWSWNSWANFSFVEENWIGWNSFLLRESNTLTREAP